jgi:hypothetical protein
MYESEENRKESLLLFFYLQDRQKSASPAAEILGPQSWMQMYGKYVDILGVSCDSQVRRNLQK